jgi:flavin reductase (DIM6/NTAB) family NADH-FMN oxidoreductase RutF
MNKKELMAMQNFHNRPKEQNPKNNDKLLWKPGNMLYPVPVAMVSCGASVEEYNIVTIAWTGTICTNPPMCSISVRPERYSYEIIKRTGEFVINLTTANLVRAADWCGVKSGREFDKFKEAGLTPLPARHVKAPLIKESPVNMECVVKEIKPLGSHHLFMAEVVAVHVDGTYYDPKTKYFDMAASRPVCYLHGRYYLVGKDVGTFGFSVRKRPFKKK